MALDKITEDLAVVKTNGTFTGSFVTTSGTVTVSYGDLNEETSNTPSHTYTDTPPYFINVKDIDDDLITGITISGGNIVASSVEPFKNLTNLNVSNNLLPKSEVGNLLVELDEHGLSDGVLTVTNNISGGVYPSDAQTSYNNLITKNWQINGTYSPLS